MTVHFATAKTRSQALTTACGRSGWYDRGGEFLTATSSRMACTDKPEDVTCKRCQKALAA